ncbi:MAG: rubrerythrin family protein [Tissierellia bacterium]|nr:rubrerythrin family protein [Tissierellia bacterium]
MAKSLKGSKTANNLLTAFAGESQARMRYTYYAKKAKEEGYVQIRNIFEETARNEEEHAKRFYKFLAADLEGEALKVEWDFPVNFADTASNLLAAAEGEHEEFVEMYPDYAAVAEEEGYNMVAKAFREIALVEDRHERRFRKLLQNIKDNTVFKKEGPTLWKCDNCGYVYEGEEAPIICPACLHKQEYFELFVENY